MDISDESRKPLLNHDSASVPVGNSYGGVAEDASFEHHSYSSHGSSRKGSLERPRSPWNKTRQRLLSHTGDENQITLSWQDVNVFVPPPGGGLCGRNRDLEEPPKHILKDVSGIVKPGTLLAILGASGAGKSTLMNVLTYRNRGNLMVDGTVLVNGRTIGRGITSVSAYVQQDDLFIGTMTVKEHMIFQAMLRMDEDIPQRDRKTRVEEVINDLGLTKCQDTLIGIPGRMKGISGGEMKRLAFASEVLTDPPLMFCDEPTSGLDSFMAENVVQTLKGIAAKGNTILCTIHQPSSQVFNLFDQILLLAEGRVAYMGSATAAFDFFQELNFGCPLNFNPADHFVQTLAIRPGFEAECKQRVKEICDSFLKSKESQNMYTDISGLQQGNNDITVISDLAFEDKSPYKANWFRQFYALLWRSMLTQKRDPMAFRIRAFQGLFIGVMLGLIFLWQPDENGYYDQKAIQNVNGLMFLLLTNMSFSNMFPVVNTFPLEFPIFRREHNNGMYRVDVYFLAKNLAELPSYIVVPTIFIAITYWMTGLYVGTTQFFIALGVLLLVSNSAVSFGYVISCISSSVTIALAVAPPLLIPLMLFGGFFLNDDSIPVYFIWLKYLSWFSVGNEVLVVNQWKDVDHIVCDCLPAVNTTASSVTTVAPSGDDCVCVLTGNQVINQLNYSEDNVFFDIMLMTALLVGFRILAFLFLLIRTWKRD